MKEIAIQYRDVESITPYENNPRKNDTAVPAVAESIKTFGFTQPIVVDSKGVIVVGHTRFLAAKSLGMKEVPVLVADNLTEEQIRAYRIADNRLGEISTWNESYLYNELVSAQDEFTGFTDEEIESLFEKYEKRSDLEPATSVDSGDVPTGSDLESKQYAYEICFKTKEEKARFDGFVSTFSGDIDSMIDFINKKLA